jgi:hypothetical protein
MLGECSYLSIINIDTVPPELLDFFKESKKQKYGFPDSDKTIYNLYTMYSLDSETREKISSLSSRFILIKLSLEYLKELNDAINNKYLIPQLTLDNFQDEETTEKIRVKVKNIQNDPLINWIKNECVDELKNLCENIVIKDVNQVIKLGNIIKLTKNELDNLNANQTLELYDTLYRLQDRLKSFDIENDSRMYVQIDKESNNYNLDTVVLNLSYSSQDKLITEYIYKGDNKEPHFDSSDLLFGKKLRFITQS